MQSKKSDFTPSQESDLALASLEPMAGPLSRRHWWLRLLVFCLLVVATYALTTYALLFYTGRAESQATQGGKAAEQPGTSGKAAARSAARAVPVDTTAAKQGNMDIYLTSLGTITAFNTVTVHTRVDGQLVKVAFQEGQIVHQGDLLAEIDPRPFQVQLEQAEGQLAQDDAQLKNARVDLERYQTLMAQDSIPKQQLDTQVALVRQDEGVIQSDQARIDNAKLQLVYSRITAPLTGRVGLRLVDPGNVVHATDQNGLVVITQLQPIAVIFSLAEDDLPQVLTKMHSGQQLIVNAHDRNLQNQLATGTLLTIDNQIDPNTGTVKCKAVFPNEDNALFPNQFVNARLLVDTKKDAVLVPTAALQRSPQSMFVYVVKNDSTVEMRNVVVGPTEGDQANVASGLAPGEVVVIEGVDKLQQGMKVAARMASDSNTKGNE